MRFNDGMGPRMIHHINLLFAMVGEQQIVFKFEGKDIPGICRIDGKKYEKNGKWSCNRWEVTLAEGIDGFAWSQDWNTGKYLGETWKQTFEMFRENAVKWGIDTHIKDETIERFIRATFSKAITEELDEKEGILKVSSEAALKELLKFQQ